MKYGLMGLKAWACGAVPALLPFMILSGTIIRMGLSDRFASLIHPLTGKLLCASKECSYVTFIGFLCGFPMGARTVSEFYERKRITRDEARWLLSFCNNLGPAFFCGIVLPLFPVKRMVPCLFGAYGIPFLYGLLLRNTVFLKRIQRKENGGSFEGWLPFGEAFSEAVRSAVNAIVTLGGYIVFFSSMNGCLQMLFKEPIPMLSSLMEITTGIGALCGYNPACCMFAFALGGLSCFAQALDSLQNKDLRACFGEYCLHKGILAFITLLYSYLLF